MDLDFSTKNSDTLCITQPTHRTLQQQVFPNAYQLRHYLDSTLLNFSGYVRTAVSTLCGRKPRDYEFAIIWLMLGFENFHLADSRRVVTSIGRLKQRRFRLLPVGISHL